MRGFYFGSLTLFYAPINLHLRFEIHLATCQYNYS